MSILTAIKDFFTPFDLAATQRDFEQWEAERDQTIREWDQFIDKLGSALTRSDWASFLSMYDMTWDDSCLPDDLKTERLRLLARTVVIRNRGIELHKRIGI